MDKQTIATIFQEGGRLLSEFIRSRPPMRHPTITGFPSPLEGEEAQNLSKKTSTEEEGKKDIAGDTPPVKKKAEVEGTACLPCVNTHFATCSGLISDEAIRMARRNGIGDEEIKRINACIDQLAAMERVDLAVDNIKGLSGWEKEIALYAQNQGSTIRHKLENIASVDDLEDVALQVKETRTKIGKDYFKSRLSHLRKRLETI